MKEKIIQFLSYFKLFLPPRRLLPVLVLLVLIAVIAAVVFLPKTGRKFSRLIIDQAYAQNNFEVRATASDVAGVDGSTAFVIKSQQAIDEAGQLKSNIKIIPEAEFDLKKINSHEFRLTPKAKLAGRQVYRLLIASAYVNSQGLEVERNFSWAFQIKDQFKVLSTLPADKATGAPLNSGMEITFSSDNFTNFENSFAIEPKAEGRFEKHGRTAVFVPTKPLAAGTIYTVKIRPELGIKDSSENLASLYQFQFETAFKESPQPKEYINFINDKYEFGLKQTPAFSVLINTDSINRQVKVNLYNYETRGKFVNELKKIYDLPAWSGYRGQLRKQHETAGLTKAASYDLTVVSNDYDNMLALPQTLPAGFYLLEAKFGADTAFTMMQITDISAYAQVNKNKILFWVNRIGSSEPVAGALIVDLKTGVAVSADQTSAALLDNPAPASYQINYYAIYSSGQTLVLPVYLDKPDYDPPGNRYWNYFYPDRALYKPTDTVNFWGFIKPRQKDLAKPKQAIVRLEKNGAFDYYNEPIAAAEAKVNLSDNGFFTGQIKFANLTPGGYNLSVNLEGEKLNLENRYLQVMAYVKPAYKITVTPKKKVLLAGEPAVYDIKTAFFEGTAVPDLELRYSHDRLDGSHEEAVIKTDQLGQASLSFLTSWPACQEDSQANCYFLRGDNLSVTPVRGEVGEVTGEASLAVIGPKIKYGKTEAKAVKPDLAEVSAEMKTIDLNNETDNYNGGPAANVKVKVKINQIEYIAINKGNYYDFINKVSYPVFDYRPKKTALPDLILTSDAAGLARGQFKIDPAKAYEINFYASDASGKVITDFGYIDNSRSYGDDPRFEDYFLRAPGGHDNYFKTGETVSLELVKNKSVAEGGQALFTKQQLGLLDYQVKSNGDYDFIFEDKYVPNVQVYAVWFDGRTYHEGGWFSAMLKPETRELKLDIKTDKEKYAPADEVNLDIKTTGPNGQGVSSEVNLNIVDEAFLELGGGADASPLNILAPVDGGFWYGLSSHRFPSARGGAEKGGGGGEPRANFPDVALFQSIKTDANGQARLKFKLPDSLTSWSVTAQAISENIYAGSGSAAIKVSLPFFIQPAVAEEYLASDQPVVRTNAYGDILKADDKITAWLEAKGLGMPRTEQLIPAFASVYFNLNKLAAGVYDLIFGGQFKSETDSVLKKIKVVDSRLAEIKKDFYELKPGAKISGARDGWTKLTFMDYGRGRLYNEAADLAYNSGSRVDQKIASQAGYKIIKDNFPDAEPLGQPAFDSQSYQDLSGGIKLLPYAGTEVELSAKIAGFAPNYFDRSALAAYFYGILNNQSANREEIILAIYGLASLNEPVLLIINDYAKLDNLAPLDKIYLALAALNIGDEAGARRLYNELLSAYGETSRPYSRLKIDDKNNDNNIRATILAAILAAGLGNEKSGEFWQYAVDNKPADWLINLEEIGYLEKLLPNLPAAAAKLTLNISGRTVNKELKNQEIYSVLADSQSLSNLSFNVSQGRVALIAEYQSPVRAGANSKYISVSKKYLVNGRETGRFKQGDIVEIRLYPRLSPQTLKGDYTITDILPSGLRLISNLYVYGLDYGCSTWYPEEVNGQSVGFNLWPDWTKYSCNNGDYFRYYAYAALPGGYTVEPALIQSEKSGQMKSYSTYEKIDVSQ